MRPSELYRHKTLSGGLKLDDSQLACVLAFDRLYDDLARTQAMPFWKKVFTPKPTAQRGLYVWGGVGRGKTMLMDLFVETASKICAVRRVHFFAFMQDVHAYLHQARTRRQGDQGIALFCRALAKDVDVLCFDEFHVSNIADAMILARLFRTLHENGVTCVMTSNRVPDDLYKGGLQADRFAPFIAHVKDVFEIIHLESATDYRLARLRDETLYLQPLSGTAQATLDRIQAKLTDDAALIDHALDVAGRTLHVRGVHGVARASFSDLCEKPLGAPDYLMLAENFHTLILERVPKLTYDRRNEAMRLMTLIDILYDRGIKLVVSADAPPERLYVGTDHAFEFQRTVSRLLEMQSLGYFARA